MASVKQIVDRIVARSGYVRRDDVPELRNGIEQLAKMLATKGIEQLYDARTGELLGLKEPKAEQVGGEAAYALHPVLFSGVKRVADSAAQIPVRVGRLDADRKFNPIPGHPALDLLEQPNMEVTGDQFRRALYSRHTITGETVTLLDFGEGSSPTLLASEAPSRPPSELHLMSSDRLHAIPDPTGVRRVGGYQLKSGGKRYPVHRSRVLHPWEFGGVGAGEVLGRTVSTDLLAEAFNNEGFRGGGSHRRLVVTFPQTMQNIRDILRDFSSRYLRPGKNRKPIGLDNDAKLTEVGQSNSDLEYGDLRRMAREYIASALGVPPSMIGILEYANYSNMEVQERILWELTIRPMLMLYQGYWTRFLLRFYPQSRGLVVQFDLSGVAVLQENLSEWVEVAKGISEVWGMADTDQLREIVTSRSIDPLSRPPDPAKVIVPLAVTTLDKVRAGMTQPTLEAPGGAEKAGGSDHEDHAGTWGEDSEYGVARPSLDPVTRKSIHRAWLASQAKQSRREQERLEARFRRDVITPVLTEWESIITGHLETQKAAKVFTITEVDSILKVVESRDEANRISRDAAERFHTRVVDLRARRLLSQLPGSAKEELDLTLPWVQAFLQEKPLVFSGEWRKTVLGRLRRQLAERVAEEGVTISKLQNTVSEVMSLERGPRALMVARTEATAAYEFGAHAAYVESEVVSGRRWVPNTERHAGVAASNGVVPLGQPFNVNGSPMMYPGDPAGPVGEIVNCGCSTVPELAAPTGE